MQTAEQFLRETPEWHTIVAGIVAGWTVVAVVSDTAKFAARFVAKPLGLNVPVPSAWPTGAFAVAAFFFFVYLPVMASGLDPNKNPFGVWLTLAPLLTPLMLGSAASALARRANVYLFDTFDGHLLIYLLILLNCWWLAINPLVPEAP